MNLPEDTLSIETPENVAFGYPIAGIGSRFLAALADTLIITILELLIYFLAIFPIIRWQSDSYDSSLVNWWLAILGLILFSVYWGYYILFELVWNGQSPGKRWQGLRVVRVDGLPIGFSESAIRNLVRLVDFLPAYYGVGVVSMFLNSQSRRLGDLAAGTLVVRDRDGLTLASLAAPIPPPARLPGSAISRVVPLSVSTLPVERLRSQDIQLAETFMSRRETLPNRASLARQITQALYQRMNLPWVNPPDTQVEEILASILRAAREKG